MPVDTVEVSIGTSQLPIGTVEVPIGTPNSFARFCLLAHFGLFFGHFSKLGIALGHVLDSYF